MLKVAKDIKARTGGRLDGRRVAPPPGPPLGLRQLGARAAHRGLRPEARGPLVDRGPPGARGRAGSRRRGPRGRGSGIDGRRSALRGGPRRGERPRRGDRRLAIRPGGHRGGSVTPALRLRGGGEPGRGHAAQHLVGPGEGCLPVVRQRRRWRTSCPASTSRSWVRRRTSSTRRSRARPSPTPTTGSPSGAGCRWRSRSSPMAVPRATPRSRPAVRHRRPGRHRRSAADIDTAGVPGLATTPDAGTPRSMRPEEEGHAGDARHRVPSAPSAG
jgi:hypothetical protein